MCRKTLIILGIIIILLIAFRIALPYTLVWYVNRSIQDLPDYQGKVNNVDLQLLRGNASLNDIELVKRPRNRYSIRIHPAGSSLYRLELSDTRLAYRKCSD
jgi:hypothetical protein